MLVNQSLSWITQTDPWHSCRKRVFHISNERTIVIGELFCPDTPHHVRTSSGVSTRSQSMSGVSLHSSTTTPADCPVEPPSKPVWPPCQGKSICCYIHNMIVLHTHTHTHLWYIQCMRIPGHTHIHVPQSVYFTEIGCCRQWGCKRHLCGMHSMQRGAHSWRDRTCAGIPTTPESLPFCTDSSCLFCSLSLLAFCRFDSCPMTTAISLSMICFHIVPTLTCNIGKAFPFDKVVITDMNTNLLNTGIVMCGAGDRLNFDTGGTEHARTESTPPQHLRAWMFC